MNNTAAEIQDFVHASIEWLTRLPGRSKRSVYTALAEASGLSQERVRKFHNAELPNLTVDALDRLVEAVRAEIKKTAV